MSGLITVAAVRFEAVAASLVPPHLFGAVSEQSLLSLYTGGMKKKQHQK